MKIKRVKGGLVMWAKTFAKGGNVTEWSKNEADGKDFDAGVIEDRDLASAVVSHDLGAWATAKVWLKLLETVGLSTAIGAR